MEGNKVSHIEKDEEVEKPESGTGEGLADGTANGAVDKRSGGKLRKGDFLLLLGVLAFCGILWGAAQLFSSKGKTVTVTDADHNRVTMSLDTDSEQKIFSGNGWNVITILEGKVRVSSADCPEQICVNHRPIDTSGEVIICLPHKLTVEVE